MKVLLINNQHEILGGAHRVYRNTGSLLEQMGHEVKYFSTKQQRESVEAKEDWPKQSVVKKDDPLFLKIKGTKRYLFNNETYKKLKTFLKVYKPDVAHVHLFYGILTISVLKALYESDVPVVHTVHDYKLICPVNTFLDGKGSVCEKCLGDNFYYCAIKKCSDNKLSQSLVLTFESYLWKNMYNPLNYINKFIFVSDFSMAKHVQANKLFQDKGTLIYNWSERGKDKGIIRGSYYLYFGRLSEEKGIETLLIAFKKSKLPLKIVGKGPLEERVREYSRNTKNIEYLGFKTGNELENLIYNSNFVLVPSEWYENNPMTIVESFSHSKPVIASRTGGVPELIQNNSILFETGSVESLNKALEFAEQMSDDKYVELSKNAGIFAQNYFSKEVHYNKLIEVYKKAIYDQKHH